MKKPFVMLFVILLGVFFLTQATVVKTKKKGVPLYRNLKRELNEKRIYTAAKGENLTVIEESKDMIKVRTKTGMEGWLQKGQVKKVKGGKGKASLFKMDEAKVQGFLDNPQAVYILDMSDPNFKPIKLDRSFSDNLAGNIDKETNQRINDPSLKPSVVKEK